MESHPGTMGYLVKPHSFLIWCRSEWQMPQYKTLNCTSFSPLLIRTLPLKRQTKKGQDFAYLLENLNGERSPEVSLAAYPKALTGCSSSCDAAILPKSQAILSQCGRKRIATSNCNLWKLEWGGDGCGEKVGVGDGENAPVPAGLGEGEGEDSGEKVGVGDGENALVPAGLGEGEGDDSGEKVGIGDGENALVPAAGLGEGEGDDNGEKVGIGDGENALVPAGLGEGDREDSGEKVGVGDGENAPVPAGLGEGDDNGENVGVDREFLFVSVLSPSKRM
nr:hypothetical protein Iba_chr11dCG0610 [Ipomoea batatas]